MAAEYITPQSSDQPDQIDTPCLAYNEMNIKWRLIHDLLGGTIAMRNAAYLWLPKEPKEDDLYYRARVARSFLFNGFKNAIQNLSSKPYIRPVTITKELPQGLAGLNKNMDGAGSDITTYNKNITETAITYGLTHILVDFPSLPKGSTMLEENAASPSLVHIKPPSLIGWETEVDDSGNSTLSQIRIKEERTEPVGTYGQRRVQYVRLIENDHWELWRRSPQDKQWRFFKEGVNSLGYIPLVTIYFNRTGYMTADPPLEDLAWLNVAHWQSQSDQRNILRFARCGILFGKGFAEEELKGITVSPTTLVKSTNESADLRVVEHSGAAIGAGRTDLRDLEDRMELLGMRPMTQQNNFNTATSHKINDNQDETAIQAWIRVQENGIERCLEIAAEWKDETLEEGTNIDIFNEFGVFARGETDIDHLVALASLVPPRIDDLTLLKEIKRRGLFSDDMDPETVLQAIKDQGPALAQLTNRLKGGTSTSKLTQTQTRTQTDRRKNKDTETGSPTTLPNPTQTPDVPVSQPPGNQGFPTPSSS